MASVEQLEGIVVPIASPLDEQERIDEPALRRMVERLITAGVNGIFAAGTTGEFSTLSDGERRRSVEIVVDQVRQRIPVLAGVSAEGTDKALKWAAHAEQSGADAVVLTAPYYYGCTEDEALDHFLTVARKSALPLFVYNMPRFTGFSLTLEGVGILANAPEIHGMKDSSNDFVFFSRLLGRGAADGWQLRLFQGNECLLGPSLMLGAHGGVVGLGNVAPELFVELYRVAKQGQQDRVSALQHRVIGLFELSRMSATPLAGLKAALHVLDLCSRRMTQPYRPLPDDRLGDVEQVLVRAGVVEA